MGSSGDSDRLKSLTFDSRASRKKVLNDPGVKEGNEGASATQSGVPALKSEIRLSIRGRDQKLPRSTPTATLGGVNYTYNHYLFI